MNERMYQHPAVQANLERLREQGCHIMEPAPGAGLWHLRQGRMPEPHEIADFVRAVLTEKISGVRALVTAGPTRSPRPGPVYQQPLTGLMGYAMARALVEGGRMLFSSAGPAA